MSLADFYTLPEDSTRRLHSLTESALKYSLDRDSSLTLLVEADRLQAKKAKDIILRYISEQFNNMF